MVPRDDDAPGLATLPDGEACYAALVGRFTTLPERGAAFIHAQGLAYKTGQIEILRLRALAETALGDAFRLAAFHDVVLGSGAVTRPVLESQVTAWIAGAQGG